MTHVTRELVEQGRLIEAGFVVLRSKLDPEMPLAQVRELRRAYYYGAQHLFFCICRLLHDHDAEPTVEDEQRMNMLADELAQWAATEAVTKGTA